jgi:DNA polymerase
MKTRTRNIPGPADLPDDARRSLAAIDRAIHDCRRCPIGFLDNRAVMGEGPRDAALMIVGEQPGDREDQEGRPFVGPAGRVLDEHLEAAGIDRARTYVTNAVKHFKFVPRGKRRLHQKPTAGEIDTCRFWLAGELELVRPAIVLALGGSALRALLGRTTSIASARGKPHLLDAEPELWATIHPSYLLRLEGAKKEQENTLFRRDLERVAERLQRLMRSAQFAA